MLRVCSASTWRQLRPGREILFSEIHQLCESFCGIICGLLTNRHACCHKEYDSPRSKAVSTNHITVGAVWCWKTNTKQHQVTPNNTNMPFGVVWYQKLTPNNTNEHQKIKFVLKKHFFQQICFMKKIFIKKTYFSSFFHIEKKARKHDALAK